jgi:small subunit ribosomal protein S17
MADETPENEEATAAAVAAAEDAEKALEAVEAEAEVELPATSSSEEAVAAAEDAAKALDAVEAEAARELPVTAAAAEPEEDGPRPNRRKVREGIVVSDAMSATVVVAVVERVRHPKYGKTVQRTKKLYVHDAEDSAKVGDRVRVQETRPLSKLKRWRLTEVLERAR